jgi:hypothetical protein
MFSRLLFIATFIFWIVMNVLLWRFEFHGTTEIGAPVSASLVWDRILTAPDDSMLELQFGGRKIGYFRWFPNVGEGMKPTGEMPEGMVRNPSQYKIRMEGSLRFGDEGKYVRFGLNLALGVLKKWTEFDFSLMSKPHLWRISSKVEEKFLRLEIDQDESSFQEKITFEDLGNPFEWIRRRGDPLTATILQNLFPKDLVMKWQAEMGESDWKANHAWISLGRSRIKVYRLSMGGINRESVILWVSRVGEIFKVELPNQVSLINEVLVQN